MILDKATIEIDCSSGVVSANCDSQEYFSLGGTTQLKCGRASLIVDCLFPEVRKLMAMSTSELQARSLVAMGIEK